MISLDNTLVMLFGGCSYLAGDLPSTTLITSNIPAFLMKYGLNMLMKKTCTITNYLI